MVNPAFRRGSLYRSQINRVIVTNYPEGEYSLLSRKKWMWIIPSMFFLMIYVFGIGCEKKDKSDPGTGKAQTRINPEERESPQEGFLAPSFSLPRLNGSVVNLIDYKGRVVLVNFWATWCGPCKMEIPSLIRLYQKRKSTDFEIVAISLDRTPASKVADFVKAKQMDFPILLNPEGEVSEKYLVRGIPASFLIDKKGMIRWKVVGGVEWDGEVVLNKIDQLLAE
jgi:peroxiredoxin